MSDERKSIGGGARLRAAREARGASIESVAAELRIRVPIIRGLEAEDQTYLPERIYTLGMLRNYATYLGLDPEAIIGSWAGFPAVTRGIDTEPIGARNLSTRLIARITSGPLRTFAAYGGIGILGIVVMVALTVYGLQNWGQTGSTPIVFAPIVAMVMFGFGILVFVGVIVVAIRALISS